MTASATVTRYFQRAGIQCAHRTHDRAETLFRAVELSGVDPACVVNAEFWIDSRGVLMTVVPFGESVSPDKLHQATGRSLERLGRRQAQSLFKDCEPGSYPPIASAYGLNQVCDTRIAGWPEVIVQSGCHTTLLVLQGEAKKRIFGRAKSADLASPLQSLESPGTEREADLGNMASVSDRLTRLYGLPAIPVAAQDLLELAFSRPSIADCCEAIAAIPGVEEALRADLALLNAEEPKPLSLEHLVRDILGPQRCLLLAFAHCVTDLFRLPKEGRLGQAALWARALARAEEGRRLALSLPSPLDSGTVYLSGLLYEIGWYVLATLFQPEYRLLVTKLDENPLASPDELESAMLGLAQSSGRRLRHGVLGRALLSHWQLPDAVINAGPSGTLMGGPANPYGRLIRLAGESVAA